MSWTWLLNLLLSLLLPFSYVLSAGAIATNRTIDDSLGDSITGAKPTYLPPTAGVWEDGSCTGCAIRPDRASAFKGTWTAATYNPGLKSMSIELNFKGTAIYIYFILANYAAPGITTETACNFTLDGAHAGLFKHTPSLSTALQYNALVFSRTSLLNDDHKLVIETNDVDHDVFVNFDYAIYTFDDTPPPSSSPAPLPVSTSSTTTSSSISGTSSGVSSSTSTAASNSGSPTVIPGGGTNTGNGDTSSGNTTTNESPTGGKSQTNVAAIAGGTVGGVVALGALIFGLLFCLKRRQRNHEMENSFPSDGTLFAPLNHSNDSRPAISRYRNVPPPLVMNQHNTRPVTHSDFLQSGTIIPTASTSMGGSPGYSGSDHAYGGIINDYAQNGQHQSTLQPNEVTIAPFTKPSLVPVRRPSDAQTTSSGDTRQARQQELENQLRVVNTEMQALKGDVDRKSSTRTRRNPSQDQEIQNLREQMRIMSEQILALRKHQNSDWAQGQSDEPPPGYTPSFSVRNS